MKEATFKRHLTCREHHPAYPLEKVYYCGTCLVPVCPECWFLKHVGHERQILKQVYEQRKQELLAVLEPFESITSEFRKLDLEMSERAELIEAQGHGEQEKIGEFFDTLLQASAEKREREKSRIQEWR